MDKTIATLALIFELTEVRRFEINRDALQIALRWEKYLLSHIKRLHAVGDRLNSRVCKINCQTL